MDEAIKLCQSVTIGEAHQGQSGCLRYICGIRDNVE